MFTQTTSTGVDRHCNDEWCPSVNELKRALSPTKPGKRRRQRTSGTQTVALEPVCLVKRWKNKWSIKERGRPCIISDAMIDMVLGYIHLQLHCIGTCVTVADLENILEKMIPENDKATRSRTWWDYQLVRLRQRATLYYGMDVVRMSPHEYASRDQDQIKLISKSKRQESK